jgi:hypothetical protein
MKKETIFEIALKLLGIYLSQYIVYSLLGLIKIVFSKFLFSKSNKGSFSIYSGGEGFSEVYFSIGFEIVFYALIVYFLLFKTRWIINLLLKSDSNRNEIVNLTIGVNHLYRLTFIVVGIFIFTYSIYELKDVVTSLLKSRNIKNALIDDDFISFNLFLITSIILVVNSNKLAEYFTNKTNVNSDDKIIDK